MMRNVSAVFIVCLVLGMWSQIASAQGHHRESVQRYKLYNVGAEGQAVSIFFNYDQTGGQFSPFPLNHSDKLAAIYASKSGIANSMVWANGRETRLPGLPHSHRGGGGSNALGINDNGLVIGLSNDGTVAPNGYLYNHAVSWQNGAIQNLGDLGGHDSDAFSVNNSGLIAGFAFNTTPDPYSFYGTQLHATTWLNGQISDLGTLGGTDSQGSLVNDAGQVIGISFLNTQPEPPFNQPQDDAFLWSNGTMIDLGTLGGSFSLPSSINSNGQVAVLSLDATNSFFQSYLWSGGATTVLNSVGGNFVEAVKLNDTATIVGWNSDVSDTYAIAALWSPDGSGQLLGTIGSDTGSIAFGINNDGVVVGASGTITLTGTTSYVHAFIWQDGQMQDLNTLIRAGSPLTLNVAYDIADDGTIAGLGTDKTGNVHAFILKPECDNCGEFLSAASQPAAPGGSIVMPSPLEMNLRAARALREAR